MHDVLGVCGMSETWMAKAFKTVDISWAAPQHHAVSLFLFVAPPQVLATKGASLQFVARHRNDKRNSDNTMAWHPWKLRLTSRTLSAMCMTLHVCHHE
jgi:hypothetical protein